ncbi:MAG: hypothetical protein ACQETH_00420 [Candidatus Rifleibacteriota bacterium]
MAQARSDYSYLNVDFVKGNAFWKYQQTSPFEIKPGKIQLKKGLTLLTIFDGHCFVSDQEKEIRLKESSLLVFKEKEQVEIRKGIVGIKNDSGNLKITIPHAYLEMQKGIVVIKTNPILTRISVVKGEVFLFNKEHNSKVVIAKGKEVAAGGGMFSKFYQQTNELRYSWYWVKPSMEPSLRP